eukprot:TRINITY_DN6838_c0_g2_i3.p1 TRINITY_DN6838_c0_g2~~TRINITY_DN6838_c0_g2_i3.p1  ORF type:complete len:488 (-),score=64.93 TRINITY_DN6838_c0_g2_i3:164-1549(-)
MGDKLVSISLEERVDYQHKGYMNGEIQKINTNEVTSFEIELPSKKPPPSGEWYHAAFHTVTSVVGVGVLGLPYALSSMGWGAGLIMLIIACSVSYYTSYLLVTMHESKGTRFSRYRDLGAAILGERGGALIIVPFQFIVLVGLDITYMVTAGQSMMTVQREVCAGDTGTCSNINLTEWIIIFGAMQLLLSQLPDLHSLWWVSLMGAFMSLCYSMIAFGGSIAVGQDEENIISYHLKGDSQADKVFLFLNALGAVTFAYGGHSVMLEIQATLKAGSRNAMMFAVSLSYVVVILCYFPVAIAGYAAFGNSVEADVLISISSPHWLVALGNAMVLIHILASYQVYSQPVFEAMEHNIQWSLFGANSKIFQRLVLRSTYVVGTCFVACTLPFFGDLMGFFGAIGFTPMTFVMPSVLWLAGGYEKTTGGKILNYCIAISFSIIGVMACIGALRLIINDAHSYHFYS